MSETPAMHLGTVQLWKVEGCRDFRYNVGAVVEPRDWQWFNELNAAAGPALRRSDLSSSEVRFHRKLRRTATGSGIGDADDTWRVAQSIAIVPLHWTTAGTGGVLSPLRR